MRWRLKSPASRSKFHVTSLCEGNTPVTSGFPSQMARQAENVSIWWCHHVIIASSYGWLYSSQSRFQNQYWLIVKEIPWNFGGHFIKTICIKASKCQPQYQLILIHLLGQFNPDERGKLLVDMKYVLLSESYTVWNLQKELETIVDPHKVADNCRRHFKNIFLIYQKVLCRMTYRFGLYRKQLIGCVACEFVKLHGTAVLIAWEWAKQWLPSAWDCGDMRPPNAWKCVDLGACVVMRFASISPNHGSSAWDASGKHLGSAARVQLKCPEPLFHAFAGHIFLWDQDVKG